MTASGPIGSLHAAGVEPSAGVRCPPQQRFMLANGVRVILIPQHHVPLIACEALLRGGARLDPPGRKGLAALSAELLTHGAGELDAFGFADRVEGAGGLLAASVRSEALVMHGQFLARDRTLMIALLADVLQRPHLAASELETLRARRIEFIRAAKDSDPQALVGTYGRSLLFGAHPLAKPVEGSERGLAAITHEDVQAFYREQFGADRLTLVFAGDFEPQQLRDELSAAFASWRTAAAPLTVMAPPPRLQSRRVLLVDSPDSTQTYFWLGNVGVARQYPRRAALELANTAFGGSFGSMLMQALRVREGLTYSVSSSFRRGSVAGEYAIRSFTATASTARALQVTLQTLDALKGQGLSPAAIASASSYLAGQYPLGFETGSDWAAAFADLDLYGLGQDYIENFVPQLQQVDAAAVREVIASAFPSSDELAMVLIGDAGQIRSAAAQFGRVIEKPLTDPDFDVPE